MATNGFPMQVPGGPFNNSPSLAFRIGNQSNQGAGLSSSSSNCNLGSNGQMNADLFNAMKRRRTEEQLPMQGSPLIDMRGQQASAEFTAYRGRRFVPLTGCDKIYHSENVKPKGETMYLPLAEDILINMNNIEQVSFGKGTFFLGDLIGNYSRTGQGHVINLWRFDSSSKQLFISRSILFLDIVLFNEVKGMLQCM